MIKPCLDLHDEHIATPAILDAAHTRGARPGSLRAPGAVRYDPTEFVEQPVGQLIRPATSRQKLACIKGPRKAFHFRELGMEVGC